MTVPTATIEFCGERQVVDPSRPFVIGREGDLVVDSNRFLHRRLLELRVTDGLWWLANVGSVLPVTVAESEGAVQAWLSPGGRIPVVFPRISVWFTAGPSTYQLEVSVTHAPFATVPQVRDEETTGETTSDLVAPTPEQIRVLAALCEPLLRHPGSGPSQIPSNAQAANRLGWSVTKYNRKLDTVCQRLAAEGVRGLRGKAGSLAVNRRARLVEYALSTRLVGLADLACLDAPSPAPEPDADAADREGRRRPEQSVRRLTP